MMYSDVKEIQSLVHRYISCTHMKQNFKKTFKHSNPRTLALGKIATHHLSATGSEVVAAHRRLRVWDLATRADGPPDREIVHSHDFNRYLTPFRAEWDPKDPYERLAVIGR